MKLKAKIMSFSVLQDAVSIRLTSSNSDNNIIQELKDQKNKAQNVKIGDLDLNAEIKSISIRNDIHILLHSPRNKYLVNRLFEFMDSDSLTMIINSEQEKRLLSLLKLASNNSDIPEVELLYQLTTFKGKDGKFVDGKRSIYDISKKSQEVVIDKLQKMIEKGSKRQRLDKSFSHVEDSTVREGIVR
jgi:hypothetical protein